MHIFKSGFANGAVESETKVVGREQVTKSGPLEG
jgi:hypothetical protein